MRIFVSWWMKLRLLREERTQVRDLSGRLDFIHQGTKRPFRGKKQGAVENHGTLETHPERRGLPSRERGRGCVQAGLNTNMNSKIHATSDDSKVLGKPAYA
jgi:hypothetical protein